MGMKARNQKHQSTPPKHPGEPPARSDAREIIWEGDDRGRPARIIAIDKGTNDPVPCQLIYEVLMQDTLLNESWGEQGYKGMSLLEKQLVVELTTLNKRMPKWGTVVAQARRDEEEALREEKMKAFYDYEREQHKAAAQEAAEAKAAEEEADAAEGEQAGD